LSDKLLKSSATGGLTVRCEVAYITLSSFGVNPFSQDFFRRFSFPNLLTRRCVSRCSVSVEAHYREFLQADKG
jgi:hypothetical protein